MSSFVRLILAGSVIISNLYAISINDFIGKEYKGCGETKELARQNLSNNILVNIQSDISITKKSSLDNYDRSVISKSNQSSNLELVGITFKKSKKDGFCAYAKYQPQVEHATELKERIIKFNVKLLPKDNIEKLKIVNKELHTITQFENARNAFNPKVSEKESIKIATIKKTLIDIKSKLLRKLNSQVWKACASTNILSLEKLNSTIFLHKTAKKKDTTLLSKLSFGLFSSSNSDKKELKDLSLNMLKNFINSYKMDNNYCNSIEKNALFEKLIAIYNRRTIYVKENLPSNPKEQIKKIDYWLNELNQLQRLVHLFPNYFTSNKILAITNKIKELKILKSSINPQYVIFKEANSGTKIVIDDKIKVKIDEKIYLKTGDHSYVASIKGSCPISDKFELQKNKDNKIDISFEDSKFPIVRFNSNKIDATLLIDGKKYNIATDNKIPLCSSSVKYNISYQNQNYAGMIELKPNEKIVKNINFLTSLELKTFNKTDFSTLNVKKNTPYQGSLSDENLISNSLEFEVSKSPENGSLELSKNGSFIYTPNKNFRGKDAFRFKVNTPDKTSPDKLVNIVVTGSNEIPVAQTSLITMQEGDTYSNKLKANDKDGDKLTFKLVEIPKNGTIKVEENGDFKYTPYEAFFGKDSFDYSVSDKFGGKATQKVTIIINRKNTKPEVQNQKIVLNKNQVKEFKLKYNDKDGDKLKLITVKDVTNGGITCNKLKICQYTPLKDFVGEDSFTYKVNDGIVNSDEATVTFEIKSVQKVAPTKKKVKVIQKKNEKKAKKTTKIEMSEKDYVVFKELLNDTLRNKDYKRLEFLKAKYPNAVNRWLHE